MKKVVLTFVIFLNLLPYVHKGTLGLAGPAGVYAQAEGEELGDEPCIDNSTFAVGSPYGDQYTIGTDIICDIYQDFVDCSVEFNCHTGEDIAGTLSCGDDYTVFIGSTICGTVEEGGGGGGGGGTPGNPPDDPGDGSDGGDDGSGGGGGGGGPSNSNPCSLTASLSIQVNNSAATSAPPLQPITLTAIVNPSGTPSPNTITYRFEVSWNGTNWFVLRNYNSSNTYTFTPPVLGTLQYRIRVMYYCDNFGNTLTTTPVTYNTTYCTFATDFSSKFDDSWQNTINYTKINHVPCEYSFLAYFDGTNIANETPILTVGTCLAEETSHHYVIPTPSQGNPTIANGRYYIGAFHTHPLLTDCSSSLILLSGPSAVTTSLPNADLSTSNVTLPFELRVRTLNIQIMGGQPSISGTFPNYTTNPGMADFSYGINNCTKY